MYIRCWNRNDSTQSINLILTMSTNSYRFIFRELCFSFLPYLFSLITIVSLYYISACNASLSTASLSILPAAFTILVLRIVYCIHTNTRHIHDTVILYIFQYYITVKPRAMQQRYTFHKHTHTELIIGIYVTQLNTAT